MRVRVHAADEGGCGWYRMRFPARACREAGLDVELRDDVPGWIREQGDLVEIAAIDPSYDADVAVFQRPLRRQIVETMGRLQARGVAVVVDMDDDFHALPVGHQARRDTSASANPDANRLWLRRACARADLVTVSTPALAERYGAHGRCVVLRNCVPQRYLDVGERAKPLDSERVTVGWTGSTATHVGDLDVTGGGAGQAVASTGAAFHVVGTGIGVRDGLDLAEEPTATGWVPFDRYAAEYARLDVAIVPLADNRFNHAKSWLKGIEAAALGVPFVASTVAEYRQLTFEGAGYLAADAERWAGWVGDLVRKPSWRAEAAEHGRAVASRWTYEARWGDWATAWAEALANAHQRRKKAA